jgi:hypothetical protein
MRDVRSAIEILLSTLAFEESKQVLDGLHALWVKIAKSSIGTSETHEEEK